MLLHKCLNSVVWQGGVNTDIKLMVPCGAHVHCAPRKVNATYTLHPVQSRFWPEPRQRPDSENQKGTVDDSSP